ncbi:hypothetical protein [Serratia fonticola]|uniref:hypothetical protein n=1 Tax=Serratia fonticola TaxID=47917 RepID=UPI00093928BD|nr:hypothetical protein [Serratia fonticola]OKP17401.1 hypothetical protein BSQ40_28650 [Serratia fonticola]
MYELLKSKQCELRGKLAALREKMTEMSTHDPKEALGFKMEFLDCEQSDLENEIALENLRVNYRILVCVGAK